MSTNTTVYLEQYLDSLENLPTELKKNFNKMHDLDTRNKDILVDIDTASDDYLRKVRDLSPAKRKAEMEKIQVGCVYSSLLRLIARRTNLLGLNIFDVQGILVVCATTTLKPFKSTLQLSSPKKINFHKSENIFPEEVF